MTRRGPIESSRTPICAAGTARSVFCLPLLRQGKLAGVLYLENTQAACAFTPDRIAVLELLAAQAAISLENARLYGDLRESEAKYRRHRGHRERRDLGARTGHLDHLCQRQDGRNARALRPGK